MNGTCYRCGEEFLFLDLILHEPDGRERHYVACPAEMQARRDWWAETKTLVDTTKSHS